MTFISGSNAFPRNSVFTLARSVASILVIGFLVIILQAQSATDGSTPLALTPGSPSGSYPLSDMDSVNLFNGTLNFRLPLLGVAGRGGAGYPITLHIDKKWTVYKHLEPGVGTFYYPDGGWWSEDGEGWRFFEAGKVNIRSARREQPTGFPVESLTRITFTAPDGTEYELRDQQTGGQPISPSGGFNRGKVFITADGSSATFISDADILDDPTNGQGFYDDRPEGYLLLKDGMRFRVDDGKVSWMRDRNGNKVSFTYDFLRRVTSVTDSLGRQVTITYPTSSVTFTAISFKGFGGTTRTMKIGQANVSTALRSGYTHKTLPELFPTLNGVGSWNTTVVTYVELPDGRQYQFQYNDYAELARIILPTGGAIEYDYASGLADGHSSGVFSANDPTLNKYIYRRVVERRIYPDGASGANYESRMIYGRPETTSGNDGYVITEQFNQAGTRLSKSKHYFKGSPRLSFSQKPTHYAAWEDGREYKTEVFDTNGLTILRTTTNTFAQRAAVSWWTGTAETEPQNDPRLIQSTTAIEPSGANLVSKQTFEYDQYNNQTQVYEYDFDSGTAGSLVRRSQTDYVTNNSVNGVAYDTLNPNATSPSITATFHIRSLPKQSSTFDTAGIKRASVAYEYDNYTGASHAPLVPRGDIIGLCDGTLQNCQYELNFKDANVQARGNLTASTSYLLTNGSITGSVSSYQQYDIAGNVVKTIDPRANPTIVEFDDRFGTPNAEAQANGGAIELGSLKSYAFPTKVTNALGHIAFTQFDFYLGQPVDAQDANGVTFTASYNDLLDRPKQLIKASNVVTGEKSQISFDYDDVNRVITSTSDHTAFNDSNPLKSQTVYDLMGRTIETRQYETASTYITVRTDYDALGRAYRSSNPYRAGENLLWTTSTFDALGRVKTVTTPDSAVVTTAYSGNTVTVTDQNSKSRKSVTDALGRLKEVFEDPTPNGLNYVTSYSYDVLDNLRTVTQGVQTRTFVYDSLKRLSSATNPESGTICYGTVTAGQCEPNGYDANGNLTKKTDARLTVTTYAYDALNRNTSVDYSNTSDINPDITRIYDTGTNGIGRLRESYAGGTETAGTTVEHTKVVIYDALGRPRDMRQRFKTASVWSGEYPVRRDYNLAGAVTSQTYPSERTVSYGYDGAGRANSFTGTLGDGSTRSYSSEIVYSPLGGMTKEKFGTDTAIYNKSFYNSRGQLAEIRVGTYHATDNTWWNRGAIINHYSNNCWGMCYNPTTNTYESMADNNGNLKKQDVYIPENEGATSYKMWTQQFDYDSLNRLSWVKELNSAGTTLWQQVNDYDRYGNRTILDSTTEGINKKEFTVNPANNRLGVPSGTPARMDYDVAGNLVNDTHTSFGRADGQPTRLYDGENRLTTVKDANLQEVSSYTYNADGQRVRRKIGGLETWGIYGFDGELLAEYAATTSPATPQKEYGYRNGQLLITAELGSNNPPPTSGLVGFWKFDENTGNAAPDSSASGIHGTLQNGPAWTTGQSGAALNFDGSNDMVSSSGLANVTNNFTVSFWALPGAPHEIDGESTSGIAGVSGQKYVVWPAWYDSGHSGVGISMGTNGVSVYEHAPGYMPSPLIHSATLSGWTHVAIVYENRQPKLYINGTLVRTGLTSPMSVVHMNPQFLGGQVYGYYNGKLDEVRVYNRALSAGEVSTLPNATVTAYKASTGFSSVQGQNNWYYVDENNALMNYDGTNNVWVGVEGPHQWLWATGGHPGGSHDSVRQWRATSAGTIRITGLVADGDPGGGDGIVATIKKGASVLWQQTVANGNTTGLSYDVSTSVAVGDQISFVINRNSEGMWDSTVFDPTVTFNTGGGTSASINWLVADQLGTPRMVIDQTGALNKVKRHDYLPFGEELLAGQGLRTGGLNGLGYNADTTRQKFTSYKRDTETGLDYAQARYYGSTLGRFTSPDEFSGGPDELYNFAAHASANPTFYAELSNPQSLNKYQYVYNNPLRYIDPSGHEIQFVYIGPSSWNRLGHAAIKHIDDKTGEVTYYDAAYDKQGGGKIVVNNYTEKEFRQRYGHRGIEEIHVEVPNEPEALKYIEKNEGRIWNYNAVTNNCVSFATYVIEQGGGKAASDGSFGENPKRYPRDARDGYKKQNEKKKKSSSQTNRYSILELVGSSRFSPRSYGAIKGEIQ